MNIGFLLNHLGPSQLVYYTARNMNSLVKGRTDISPIFLTENISRPCMALSFAHMNISELWGLDGIAIATTLTTAHKLIPAPGKLKKYFYVWDLEWLRMQQINYHELLEIYRHPKLNLIARCKEHAYILENAFNTKVAGIVEDVNLKQLLGVLQIE